MSAIYLIEVSEDPSVISHYTLTNPSTSEKEKNLLFLINNVMNKYLADLLESTKEDQSKSEE